MSPSTQQRLLSTATIPTLLLSLAALIQPTVANPFPKDDLHDSVGSGFLMDRSCATYCGSDNQYCCAEGQACTTSGTIAGCTNTADGGGYGLYTSTWTECDTYTTTVSSYYPATTASAGGTCTPEAGSNQVACGSICCASWQYCAYDGQCSANAAGATTTAGAGSGGTTYQTTYTSDGVTYTTGYSAPYRVTGTGTATGTAFLESSTATGGANGTAVTTGGASLSGGAIAGIVIGVIAGVIILLAICACCLMRGLWHSLLAIFGLGPNKKQRARGHDRETIIIEEERYARHGGGAGALGAAGTAAAAGAAGRRDRHDGWFAARPARSAATDSRRISESEKRNLTGNAAGRNTNAAAGAGAMGTLAAMLGLRNNKNNTSRRKVVETKRVSRSSRPARPRSDESSSYFSDSYTADSPSEFSSDVTYSSVYTQPEHAHAAQARGAVRPEPAVRDAGRGRRDYYKSNAPPDYAVSASSGGRTRDSRRSRSRRAEAARASRAQSRRRS
ncbi:hypothetical protein SLS53_003107 [Cytospora paraplurivora]|uniref:Uncharacterized protein n=1 Tax=Cytospora paraplurivora TaxID=2898453 RepID=A0AAN9YJ44_9PEZI